MRARIKLKLSPTLRISTEPVGTIGVASRSRLKRSASLASLASGATRAQVAQNAAPASGNTSTRIARVRINSGKTWRIPSFDGENTSQPSVPTLTPTRWPAKSRSAQGRSMAPGSSSTPMSARHLGSAPLCAAAKSAVPEPPKTFSSVVEAKVGLIDSRGSAATAARITTSASAAPRRSITLTSSRNGPTTSMAAASGPMRVPVKNPLAIVAVMILAASWAATSRQPICQRMDHLRKANIESFIGP